MAAASGWTSVLADRYGRDVPIADAPDQLPAVRAATGSAAGGVSPGEALEANRAGSNSGSYVNGGGSKFPIVLIGMGNSDKLDDSGPESYRYRFVEHRRSSIRCADRCAPRRSKGRRSTSEPWAYASNA